MGTATAALLWLMMRRTMMTMMKIRIFHSSFRMSLQSIEIPRELLLEMIASIDRFYSAMMNELKLIKIKNLLIIGMESK
jgi:hypothetical protein